MVTEEIPNVHSVSVGVWVQAGSRDERDEENGIAHFIEHMLFKGTRRRSARQIAKEIDAVGESSMPSPVKNSPAFTPRFCPNIFRLPWTSFLTSTLTRSLRPRSWRKNGRSSSKRSTWLKIRPMSTFTICSANLSGPATPWELPILGRLETISLMDRRKLKDFFSRHYLQIPPIIVAAGRLKHEDLLRPVQKALRKIQSRPKEKKNRPPRPHPQIQIKNKQLEQVHLLLGTQGLAAVHPRRYAFTILNTILGGGMSSRLFQEVREKGDWLIRSTLSFPLSWTAACWGSMPVRESTISVGYYKSS